MTAFLAATLLALVVAGALVLTWKEHRPLFPRVAAGAVGVLLVVGIYVWVVMHGHEVFGDRASLAFSDVKVAEVAGSYRISGQVKNLDPERTVSAIPLRLLIDNCPAAPGAACETLRELEQPLIISLPPGDTRPFQQVFSTTPLGHHERLRFRLDHDGPRTYVAVER